MDPNPYEAPQSPTPTRLVNKPLVMTFGACVGVWTFFAALMVMQYYDVAAHYVPRRALGPAGIAVVTAGFVLSSIYLWRALLGWPS